MANAFLYFILTVSFLALLGGIIWAALAWLNYKKVIKDDAYIVNLMSFLTDGRFIGIEKSNKLGKDGRRIIMMDPKDIDPDKIKNNIKEVKIIAGKERIEIVPKGEISADKNIKFILADSPSDYPEAFKKTDIGKAFMLVTQMRKEIEFEVKLLEEGGLRKDKMLTKIGTGEISRSYVKFYEELMKDALEAAVNSKDKPKASSLGSVNQS